MGCFVKYFSLVAEVQEHCHEWHVGAGISSKHFVEAVPHLCQCPADPSINLKSGRDSALALGVLGEDEIDRWFRTKFWIQGSQPTLPLGGSEQGLCKAHRAGMAPIDRKQLQVKTLHCLSWFAASGKEMWWQGLQKENRRRWLVVPPLTVKVTAFVAGSFYEHVDQDVP